ncbi:MAG: transposase [Candidatus Aramenus sp.]|nr:transposase [Candidatus Aramenus sp.]
MVFSQVGALVNKLHEYGVKTYLVIEYNTSRLCAYHNVKVKRRPRGSLTVLLAINFVAMLMVH